MRSCIKSISSQSGSIAHCKSLQSNCGLIACNQTLCLCLESVSHHPQVQQQLQSAKLVAANAQMQQQLESALLQLADAKQASTQLMVQMEKQGGALPHLTLVRPH